MNTETSVPASKTTAFLQRPLIRLIVGFLLVFIPVAIVQTVIVALPVSKVWSSILLVGFTVPVAYGAYYVLVHFVERRQMAELSVPGAVGETAQGIGIGALLLGAIMLVLTLAGAYKADGVTGFSVLLRPLLLAVSSAVFEEILFRGVLFRIVEDGLGSWIALAISAAIFGALHLLNPNATLIGALAIIVTAGITLAGAFMLTRRLWLPIGIHFAWNFIQSGIFGSAVSGNPAAQGLLHSSLTGPDWLTGGAFGIEASLVTVIIGAAVGIFFLWRASKKGNIVPRS